MPVRRIEHVGLMVANLETSIAFYEEVVGLQLIKRMGHPNPDLKLAFLGVEESKKRYWNSLKVTTPLFRQKEKYITFALR